MLAPVRRWLPLALIAAAALGLRTYDLDRRPMHADEANQAVKFGELLEHGRYAFDPVDHHGPTLYYAALPVAWMRGEHSLATLTETTVRLVPALAGTLGVVLLFALAAGSGPWTAIAAAALLAVAPATVYYGRYFIQETLLSTFLLAAAVFTARWWRTGKTGWAACAGVGLGLMQATKASAPLFVCTALLALWAARPPAVAAKKPLRDLGVALVSALAVATAFYSSFGTHLAGLSDALATYAPASGRVAGGSGHEKSWTYFLGLFGWQSSGGLVWQQLLFSALAVGGAVVAVVRPDRLQRGALVYTLFVGLVLSVAPYKTPWHAVHLVPGLALLAAGALVWIPVRALGAAAFAAVLFFQWRQTELAVFLRPADARNPYAYVHSSADVKRARPLAEAALDRSPRSSVKVIGAEYWPLPWYLRGLDRVGYWSAPPEDCDGALVIASAENAPAVRARLRGAYRESFLGLRPGVLLTVFTAEAP